MTALLTNVIQKAVDDIWQRPSQDRRAVFNAVPVTGDNGVKRMFSVGHNCYVMPDVVNRYMVYDLGQLNPNLYGFDTFNNNWVSLIDACNQEEMYIQCLVNNRKLPAAHTYIMRTEFRTTLIAVRIDKAFGLLNKAANCAISFYSNYWYNTTDGALTTGLEFYSWDIANAVDISNAFTQITNSRMNSSNLMIFINGIYKDINAASDIEVGDYVELYEDWSGLGHYDIKLSSAPHFLSELDKKGKYLLLAPDNAYNDLLMFRDDISIILYNNTADTVGGTMEQGVIYDLFNDSDIRMITHRDHSIDSVRVKNIVKNQGTDLTNANLYARVFVRRGDVLKALPDDGNYIKDMYLFNREERKRFMVGTHSVIDQWKVKELEKSAFTQWMGLTQFELGQDKVRDVYSSHGLTQMAERPIKDGTQYSIPPIAYRGATVVLYDANFEMIGTDVITVAQAATGVYSLPAGAVYLEMIPGNPVSSAVGLEKSSLTNDPQGYFADEYYVKDNFNNWNAAKEGTHYDIDETNYVVKWKPLYAAAAKLKRDAGTFYRKTATLNRTQLKDWNPIFDTGKTTIPLRTARVDIWVNRRKLIEGLDYTIRWPEFRIHNVEYIADSNNIMLIAHGLPRDYQEPQFDFIKYGHVNYDERFHLSFNRPVDITIDGYYGLKEEVSFSERRLNTLNSAYREGAPYCIQPALDHFPIIFRDKLTKTSAEGRTITGRIEDYLTTLDKENIIPVVTVIPNKHEIMSYVLYQLITDLNSGNLTIINDTLSDAGVANKMLKYNADLSNDPGTKDDWDWNYILLAAHNESLSIGVSSLAYSFLERVNTMYFNGRCQLNNYLHIV